ncbi:MAG: HD domain-containing protein [Planctomycetota bacterium]|nr:HD domain-containing protein [Planctomycetota bacterium]
MRKHILAVEAVMRGLASHFGEDVELWGLAGLLHDLDYEETKTEPARHALVTVSWLKDKGVSEPTLNAILAHADKKPATSRLEHALYCADPITGLIVAAALIRPEKKLAAVEVKSVLKRMKEKRFAAGADRERIEACSRFGLELPQFLEIALKSMQGIAGQLEL